MELLPVLSLAMANVFAGQSLSCHISPIFRIHGEILYAVRDFPTKGIAVAMAAGGRFRTECKNRRETQ